MDIRNQASLLGVLAATLVVSGCGGGSKLMKEPLPLVLEAPLVIERDAQLAAALDWVVVPGGPGTWAKNAYWDEYLITVESQVPWPVEIVAVEIVDGLAEPQTPAVERDTLVAATKANQKRFHRAGIDTATGVGADGLARATAVAGGVGAFTSAQMGAALPLVGASSSAVAMLAASGAIVVGGPVVVGGGISRWVNNVRVEKELLARHSALPIALQPATPIRLNVFMPVTPGPRRVDVRYRIGAVTKTLALDVTDVLGSLHIVPPDEDT